MKKPDLYRPGKKHFFMGGMNIFPEPYDNNPLSGGF